MNAKVIFMGTPIFGLPILKYLNENYNVIAVVCQPDKIGNRGKIMYSPIKEYALDNNINILQPEAIKDSTEEILSLEPDIIITCAYGQIIPKEILEYPEYGCINVHASLLPKLRGGAPIHHAIIDGYDKTGITIMKMVSKMDAGDIISQKEIPILESDNVGTLHDKLSLLGKELLESTLPSILEGSIEAVKQNNEEVTYAWNITKEEERVDYYKTTREVFNQIRGLNPFPGAYSILNGKRVKIWDSVMGENVANPAICGEVINLYDDGIGIRTGNGEIIIKTLQLEGRNKMSAKEFLNGVVNKEMLVGRIFE